MGVGGGWGREVGGGRGRGCGGLGVRFILMLHEAAEEKTTTIIRRARPLNK